MSTLRQESKSKDQQGKGQFKLRPGEPQQPSKNDMYAEQKRIQNIVEGKDRDSQRLKSTSKQQRQSQASSQLYAVSSKIRQVQQQSQVFKKQKEMLSIQLKEANKLFSQSQKPSSSDVQKFGIKFSDIDQMIQRSQQRLQSQNLSSEDRKQVEDELSRLNSSKQKLQENATNMSSFSQTDSKSGTLTKSIQDKITNCDLKLKELVQQEQHFNGQIDTLNQKIEIENSSNRGVQDDIDKIEQEISELNEQKQKIKDDFQVKWQKWEEDHKSWKDKQQREYEERKQRREQAQEQRQSKMDQRNQESQKYEALQYYDSKVASCQQLISYLQDHVQPKSQVNNSNSKQQVKHDIGEGYSLLSKNDEADDSFGFQMTNKGSKSKKFNKNSAKGSKNKLKDAPESDKLNHNFDIIMGFENVGIKLPETKNDAENCLPILQGKLKQYQEMIQKAENGEIDLEIPKDDVPAKSDDPQSNQGTTSRSFQKEDYPSLADKNEKQTTRDNMTPPIDPTSGSTQNEAPSDSKQENIADINDKFVEKVEHTEEEEPQQEALAQRKAELDQDLELENGQGKAQHDNSNEIQQEVQSKLEREDQTENENVNENGNQKEIVNQNESQNENQNEDQNENQNENQFSLNDMEDEADNAMEQEDAEEASKMDKEEPTLKNEASEEPKQNYPTEVQQEPVQETKQDLEEGKEKAEASGEAQVESSQQKDINNGDKIELDTIEGHDDTTKDLKENNEFIKEVDQQLKKKTNKDEMVPPESTQEQESTEPAVDAQNGIKGSDLQGQKGSDIKTDDKENMDNGAHNEGKATNGWSQLEDKDQLLEGQQNEATINQSLS